MILLVGCPIYGSDSEGQRPPVPLGGCVDDFDCSQDAFCDRSTGVCEAFDYGGICLTDGDCSRGSYCERADGTCWIPNLSECRQDVDCSFGFECDFRGGCRPEVEGNCSLDSDCRVDELCIENECLAVSATCQFDFQCAAGFTCANNRCRLICASNTRCPSGTTCSGGLCEPRTGECIDSSDCVDLDTNCVEGICLRRCEVGCAESTEQCDGEGFCRPRSTPDPNAPSPTCRVDGDCTGSLCVEGICRATCDSSLPHPDTMCASFDGQVPICGHDDLCYAESEALSDCQTRTDCAEGQSCIDGRCR